MVDRAVLTTKFGELEKRIAKVRGYNPPETGAFAEDPEKLDLVAFNLMRTATAPPSQGVSMPPPRRAWLTSSGSRQKSRPGSAPAPDPPSETSPPPTP